MNIVHIFIPMVMSAVIASISSDFVTDTPRAYVHHMRLVIRTPNTDTTTTGRLDTVTPSLLGPSLRYGVDTTVSPCVDFYQYVNGDWRSRTIWGSSESRKARKVDFFSDTYARTTQRLQRLLDSARTVMATTKDPALNALGTFYESCHRMDSLERSPRRAGRDTMPRDSTRSQQCLQRTIVTLGGALGQTFAKELFASDARRRMEQLVDAIRAAIVARVEHNRWMNSNEKMLALSQLKKLHLRIGMPKEMDDYTGLVLSPTEYQQNKITIKNFENQKWIRSIGKNNRDQWMFSLLTPNAAYNGNSHAIEIPAVMFMPPFFDATGEDVINFAGVGYVLGHEIFHSLSFFGQLSTVEHVEMKTQIEQFKSINSSLGTIDDWGTNGEQTYLEDVADLGGVLAAYDAWKTTSKAKSKPTVALIDGLAPDQRFFMALGRIWRAKWRGTRFNADVHAAPFARVNAMAMQSPAFAKAFGCKDTDPMVLPANKRASIW